MAGTRLQIISSFLGPFLLWVILAGGTSLRQDLLWRRLSNYLATTTLQLFPTIHTTTDDDLTSLLRRPLATPPLRVVTTATKVSFWESALQHSSDSTMMMAQDRYGGAAVQVVGVLDPVIVQRACEQPKDAAGEEGDLWICEASLSPFQNNHTAENDVVHLHLTTDGSAFFYPTTALHQRREEMYSIFPQQQPTEGAWTLRVLIHRTLRHEWKTIASTVDQWWRDHAQDYLGPCWDTSTTHTGWKLELVSMDWHNRNLLLDSNANLTLASVAEWIPDSNQPFAILFVHPGVDEEPIWIVDEVKQQASTMAVVGNSLVAISEPARLNESLASLLEQTVIHCLGIPTETVTLSGTGTLFYEKLFYRQQLQAEYQSVTQQALLVQQILRELPPSVHVPDHILQERFLRALEYVQQSRHDASQGSWTAALEALHRARSGLRQFQTDPLLAEPPDFPIEQYLALLAPLLVPLLLPMLVTWMREYRQYRRKRKTAAVAAVACPASHT